MQKYNVKERIIDAFYSFIIDWLGSGTVDPNKNNYRYNQAIITQNLIGWQHISMGKLYGEWLILYPHSNDKHGNKQSEYI